MQASSKVRHAGVKALTALIAIVLLGGALAAPTGASVITRGNDINLAVWNMSGHAMSAAFCPNGHVSIHYQFGTAHDPCNVTPYVRHFGRSNEHYTYGQVNPGGVVVRGNGKTLYFYVYNPSVGRPFMEVNGSRIAFVEGELQTRHVGGATVKLHRRGDVYGIKQMIIEIAGL